MRSLRKRRQAKRDAQQREYELLRDIDRLHEQLREIEEVSEVRAGPLSEYAERVRVKLETRDEQLAAADAMVAELGRLAQEYRQVWRQALSGGSPPFVNDRLTATFSALDEYQRLRSMHGPRATG